jgi:hypothetical protein
MSDIPFHDSENSENNETQLLEQNITETTSNKQKCPSIMDMIREKQNDQDFNQKIGVATTLVLELYKVLMGALLVIFVPQKCGTEICSVTQNIQRDDTLSRAALSFNIITALSFLALYFVEVKRENKMINYLEVNRFTPVDNESVGEALEKLDVAKKQKIWDFDGYYQKCGYISTTAFTLNAILSFIVVYDNYLDSKTLTVFLTNILLMGLKVADVFSTVNTKKNVFYSAYLKNKVQYNDVDPDKVEELPDTLMETTDKPESAESAESAESSNKSEPSEVTPFKNNETNIPSSDKIAETTVNNQPKEEELADNSV